jgi:putative Mn2+ efflux pump MntP
MKTSSANANPEPPSVQTARGMVAANLAVPGFGSLMAKRAAGWPQAALTIVGFALTSIFGVRFIIWFLQNLNTLYGAESDPLESLLDLWRNVRWALLGIGLFAVSWLWSLSTNAEILRSARKLEAKEKPPVLK